MVRKRLLAGALVVALLATAAFAQLASSEQKVSRAAGVTTATICLVPRGTPAVEVTVTVPTVAVPALLAQTLSYQGVCAAYGKPLALGGGTVRTYAQIERNAPKTIGITFPRGMLSGLPTSMTDGHHCYDVNGDGQLDEMSECAGGHERELTLPAAATRIAGLPLKWALVNWNPHGHGAPGVYDIPHFDFHFYIQPKAERDAIRPGPCSIIVHCDDFTRGITPIPAQHLPADYRDLQFVEVAMGNHLLDQTSPEWNGAAFTRTFVYGAYDGKISFLEPMISHAWLQGVATGQNPSGCLPIKQPQSWQTTGWYPQEYCIRYRSNRDDFTVSLENFRR
ncbi:hypothetical protein C1I93_06490 [Micromonospora endophytica]|uniref:DUF5602 domain-containing protein n=2 Tax=Micromonospora endophytica TaxID=515350 RepID=A0A2W2DEL2_9ACTN|nr:hypothetical protein [Micromonospora endophytica]PZF99199.1 hypothetical protein C1I93_06490 [Micromonospora endophytica]